MSCTGGQSFWQAGGAGVELHRRSELLAGKGHWACAAEAWLAAPRGQLWCVSQHRRSDEARGCMPLLKASSLSQPSSHLPCAHQAPPSMHKGDSFRPSPQDQVPAGVSCSHGAATRVGSRTMRAGQVRFLQSSWARVQAAHLGDVHQLLHGGALQRSLHAGALPGVPPPAFGPQLEEGHQGPGQLVVCMQRGQLKLQIMRRNSPASQLVRLVWPAHVAPLSVCADGC